jgi:hypothetical protein
MKLQGFYIIIVMIMKMAVNVVENHAGFIGSF